MNGQARIPLSRLLSASVLVRGAPLLACMALAACVSPSGRQVFAEVPINPTSPARAEIEAVLARPGDFPTFAAIPAPPADLPTAEGVKAQVEEQQTEGLYVTNSTAPETWDLDPNDAFAARAKADAGDMQAPTAAEIAESEAFVAAAKARAKAPPKPK